MLRQIGTSVKTSLLLPSWNSPQARYRWFAFSLLCSFLLALLPTVFAFSNSYIIQDDFRQHGFWVWRYLDPELFPNDLIADYFQAVAPKGYKLTYFLFASLGISPPIASPTITRYRQ